MVDPERALTSIEHGYPDAGSNTVYFCVVDEAGNACSFINSNFNRFGTGIVPPGVGFSIQNRGFGFSLDRDHPNALAPGKRPYHTIIPGMMTRLDGSLYGPFGVMGTVMQPQGHLQVAVGLIDDERDPQTVLDQPRFRVEETSILVEPGMPAEMLAARGHRLQLVHGNDRRDFGRGQIIIRQADGTLIAGSDMRADGCAMGW
jgi:gamma-glutamyltranspeptidase/glutathione hydrolase